MAQNFIDIPLEKYISLNNRLSKQYKDCRDPLVRNQIIKTIYELDIPLFRAWKIFNREDKEDFEQEAFLWIERALATFKPHNGAFIHWLKKYYVLKSWTARQNRSKKDGKMQVLDGTEAAKGLELDSVFWKRVKRLCSDFEWRLLQGIFFDGLSCEQMEEILEVRRARVEKVKTSIFNRIRNMVIEGQQKSNNKPDFYQKEYWLTMNEFSDKMGYSYQHVRNLVSNRNIGWYIDKRDVIRKPVVRIHYSTDSEGSLILPRFHQRRQTKPEKSLEEKCG